MVDRSCSFSKVPVESIVGGYAIPPAVKWIHLHLPLRSSIDTKSLQAIPADSKFEKKAFDDAVPIMTGSARLNGRQRNEWSGWKR